MEKEFWMSMQDNVDVYVKKWYKKDENPVAIVQLAHGMAEHINRYDDFANFLVNKNIYVYGNDHRGHGKTGDNQGLLGYFADTDGFTKTTEDLFEITNRIKQEYPDVPLFLFGHSMGSFLSRRYIQMHSDLIDGVILSGTGYYPKTITNTAKFIANMLPAREPSYLMNSLTFGSYNKMIPKNETSFDWLTRDKKVVKTYIDDPYAGFTPTASFFYDLMDGLIHIHNKKLNKSIRSNLPLLFISGDADPVGDYSKGIWKTAQHYDSIGIENITTMLFKDGRHELLNELNKEEVYVAIYQWIKNNL